MKIDISGRKWARLIVYVIAIAFVILVVGNIKAVGNGNNKESTGVSGYKPVIVVTGSMEPVIKVNSLSVVKQCTIYDLEVGDIVMYKYGNMKITHRVKEIHTDAVGTYLITKGDANETEDRIDIKPEMVLGKIVKTYNNLAPLISYFMLSPGEINSMAISQGILFLIVVLSIGSVILYNMIEFIGTIVIAMREKKSLSESIEEYRSVVDKHMSNIDKLEEEDKDSGYNKVIQALSRGKILREIKAMNVSMKDFEKEISILGVIKKWFRQ